MSPGPAGLREDLLAGVTVVVAGGAAPSGLARHGASVPEGGAADVLVVRGDTLFEEGGGGADGVRAALDRGWDLVRPVALSSWIDSDRDGAVVLVAPRSDAGPGAEAARAGLENMARTLSIEWSRHGVRTCALLPGPETTDEELGALVAFVASPAAAYLSGTALVTA